MEQFQGVSAHDLGCIVRGQAKLLDELESVSFVPAREIAAHDHVVYSHHVDEQPTGSYVVNDRVKVEVAEIVAEGPLGSRRPRLTLSRQLKALVLIRKKSAAVREAE